MLRLLPALFAGLLVAGAASAQGTARRAIPEPSFPSISHSWDLADVRQAAVMLHRLAQEQPDDLPHYSVGSRSVFGRLTSPGVLEAPSGTPVMERLLHYDDAARLYEQILLIYARQQAAHGGYDTEVAELAGVLLLATSRTAQDLEAAREALPDTSAAAFREATEQLTAGMTQTMIGVLKMAADPQVLSQNARQRLLYHAIRTADPIARLLSPPQRADIVAQADALGEGGDDDTIAELRAAFGP